MAQIRFDIDGDVQLSRNLRTLAVKLGNTGEFFNDALTIVEKRVDDVFDKQGRNVQKSPAWRPLSAATLKARANRTGYYKNPPKGRTGILQWTGNLQKNRRKTISNKYGELQFMAPYAIHHQKPKKDGRPPKRAIIDLSNDVNTSIVKALQLKINRDIGMAGLQAGINAARNSLGI